MHGRRVRAGWPMVEDWRADSACRMNGRFGLVRRQPCRTHSP
ncbi:Hypothetical protein EPM1_2725 [Stenotrophomonas maltophilia EPM1]|nr:Hypothetical protein EPM1_2725 [Stenotrophomonas maltophilia EPM1]